MKFVVEGKMRIADEWKNFVKEVEATSKARASDIVYAKIGSDHKLKRSMIKIERVEEWKA